MSSTRTEQGGLIDRTKYLSFYYDGRPYTGFAGDTIASALLANGIRIVGRSFKYHRARGVWGAWSDEPNAVVNVELQGRKLPNCLATTTPLLHGMNVRSVNAFPSAAFDIKGGLDLLHRWLGAGFYYKTFMWPDWHWFEPSIRKMAGLGAVDKHVFEHYTSDQLHAYCDVLVIGGGPCGLAAARAAADAGQHVMLVDDHTEFGGSAYQMNQINEMPAQQWVCKQTDAITKTGAQLLPNTTAFGVYDHQLVGLAEQRGFAKAPRLWRVRAKRIVLATGAMDRPMPFPNNDRAGIMGLSAAAEYLHRYGVRVGKRIAVASVRPANAVISALTKAGAEVIAIDAHADDFKAHGRRVLKGVQVNLRQRDIDTLLVCGGVTPTVHLWSHAGGKLLWDETIAAFVPDEQSAPTHFRVIGAANGTYDMDDGLLEAESAGLADQRVTIKARIAMQPPTAKLAERDRQWIDYQHDVTVQDIDVAVQENYTSVEHLKRYTTWGMAIDQGKTSAMTGLQALASLRQKRVGDVGTTTYRPPYVPLPLTLYRGQQGSQHHHPPKRLILENEHRALSAAMCEYGGWLRPGWYGDDGQAVCVRREVLMAREFAGILDGSPLGKIEVMGPDARAFLNFICYNRIDTLKPGNIRYAFMLTEGGMVYDDGVITCINEQRFVVSCSSSHVAGVEKLLESWRQDGNNPDRIFIHNTTSQWATVTITGPKARYLLKTLSLPIDLSGKQFPHMTLQETLFNKAAMRVARVSFSGELSFELSVPSHTAHSLWKTLLSQAPDFNAGPIGLEAMSVMRAEKGYVIIGKDTDGETMPHDLGFHAPRTHKEAAFIGDRSLHTEAACASNRRQWVGFKVGDDAPMIPTGAHLINNDNPPKSIGIITSSYDSATLNKPIALGLLEQGHQRYNESVSVWHLGKRSTAVVVNACFYDAAGEKLRA